VVKKLDSKRAVALGKSLQANRTESCATMAFYSEEFAFIRAENPAGIAISEGLMIRPNVSRSHREVR